jgi:TonB family protein
MIKTAIYLAGFYIVYSLFLSRDTMYGRNRAFILLSVMISFIMPLFTINIGEQGNLYYFGKRLSEIFVTADSNSPAKTISDISSFSFTTFIFKIYIAGIIVTTLKLTADIFSLLFLIIRRRDKANQIIYFTGFNTAGFSALGYIFINKSLSGEEATEVIKHEKNHIDQNHFLDILFIETIKIFQWFNPSMYLFDRSLRAIHEYQADAGYLNTGIPVIRYQNLLLSHVFKTKIFNITNSFSNPSLIKKRMIMMTKKRSGASASLKLFLVVPIVAVFLLVISACEKSFKNNIQTEMAPPPPPSSGNQVIEITEAPVYVADKKTESASPPPPPPTEKSVERAKGDATLTERAVNDINTEEIPEEVFVVVEEMPIFPGGETELMKFIYTNIQYPDIAKENNIEGRVILRFCVTYKGGIDKVQVLKGVNPDLDQEAVRVIKMLPAWKPGKQGGKPVNVWYSVPVTFQLK